MVLALVMAGIVGAVGQDLQLPGPGDASAGALPPPAEFVADPGRIAVLLPLSGRQRVVGEAVRDGIVAGVLAAADPRLRVEFIDDSGGAAMAYNLARESGAAVIVGPLVKEAVESLLPLVGDRPVLALNFIGKDRLAPPGFYQFGLAPEDEAVAVAARALAEGAQRAVALGPDNEWGRRLLNAFNARFAADGGALVAWEFYDPAAADFSAPVRRVLGSPPARPANPGQKPGFEPGARPDIDVIFVAANAGVARLIAPALRFHGAGSLPVYATSAIYDDGARDELDLEGMLFPDSPWVIAPDARSQPAKAALARTAPGPLPLSRLYALGFDAVGLAARLANGALPVEGYAGATGRLSLDSAGRVHRDLEFARIQGGTAVPAGAPVPRAPRSAGSSTGEAIGAGPGTGESAGSGAGRGPGNDPLPP